MAAKSPRTNLESHLSSIASGFRFAFGAGAGAAAGSACVSGACAGLATLLGLCCEALRFGALWPSAAILTTGFGVLLAASPDSDEATACGCGGGMGRTSGALGAEALSEMLRVVITARKPEMETRSKTASSCRNRRQPRKFARVLQVFGAPVKQGARPERCRSGSGAGIDRGRGKCAARSRANAAIHDMHCTFRDMQACRVRLNRRRRRPAREQVRRRNA